jgi:hypothetical protein
VAAAFLWRASVLYLFRFPCFFPVRARKNIASHSPTHLLHKCRILRLSDAKQTLRLNNVGSPVLINLLSTYNKKCLLNWGYKVFLFVFGKQCFISLAPIKWRFRLKAVSPIISMMNRIPKHFSDYG